MRQISYLNCISTMENDSYCIYVKKIIITPTNQNFNNRHWCLNPVMTEVRQKGKWQNNGNITLGKYGQDSKAAVATGQEIFWVAKGQNEYDGHGCYGRCKIPALAWTLIHLITMSKSPASISRSRLDIGNHPFKEFNVMSRVQTFSDLVSNIV